MEKQLGKCENEILYLNNLIEKFESREKSNREELANLQLKLKKSNTIYEKREKYILFQESKILELQEVIYKLKERIHIMAQTPPQRRRSQRYSDPPIQPPNSNEHKELIHDIQVKCRSIDESLQGKNPVFDTPDIAEKLTAITNLADRLSAIVDGIYSY